MHKQLLLCDKPDSPKKEPAIFVSALQDELTSVKLGLNIGLDAVATTADASLRLFQPTPTVSCEVVPPDRAVSMPGPCITQETATTSPNPSGLVSRTDTASLLRAWLRLPASSAAQPSASAPLHWSADLPEQPAFYAVDSTVLTPYKAAGDARAAAARLGSTPPTFH